MPVGDDEIRKFFAELRAAFTARDCDRLTGIAQEMKVAGASQRLTYETCLEEYSQAQNGLSELEDDQMCDFLDWVSGYGGPNRPGLYGGDAVVESPADDSAARVERIAKEMHESGDSNT